MVDSLNYILVEIMEGNVFVNILLTTVTSRRGTLLLQTGESIARLDDRKRKKRIRVIAIYKFIRREEWQYVSGGH